MPMLIFHTFFHIILVALLAAIVFAIAFLLALLFYGFIMVLLVLWEYRHNLAVIGFKPRKKRPC